MLTLRDLTFAYTPQQSGKRSGAVLRGCNLELNRATSLAVMGVSGAGKSTLAHIVAGLAPRYTGGSATGLVRVADVNVIDTQPDPGMVGVLFQDAATQLFNTSVEDEVAWGLEALGMPPDEIRGRVREALVRFDLAGVRRRAPWMLSGGQQKRLALAAIWAMQPQLLVLDEPLGGLDPEGRFEVLDAIEDLALTGTTLLVMTLRPEVARCASQIVLLDKGQMTDPLPARHLEELVPRLAEIGVIFPPEMWPDLSCRELGGVDMPALEVTSLHFYYPDGTYALQGIDLVIPAGQFVAIVGRNGAGKSTLVRHFNGLLRATRGDVRVLGKSVHSRPTGELAREVAYLFQRPEQQFFASTVREELTYGPARLELPGLEARLERVMSRFSLSDMADLPPALLSYGDQRTVTLATLAMLDTPIVILDEPTVGLDGQGIARLMDWLVDVRRRGATVVVVTHELELARRADRIVALEAGSVRADGKPDDVLHSNEVRAGVL